MSSPKVYELLFDDENEEKIGSHNVTPEQLLQVIENTYKLLRNRKTGRAPYLVVGTDDGGACIAMPIEETHDPEIWRAVTAWYCKKSELALLG